MGVRSIARAALAGWLAAASPLAAEQGEIDSAWQELLGAGRHPWLRWRVDPDGCLEFRDDVYGLDAALAEELARGPRAR